MTALCKCGCGLDAGISTRARRDRGYKKGDQLEYLRGHRPRDNYIGRTLTPPKPRRINECGHPERPHASKGMCRACAMRAWHKAHPGRAQKWRKANPDKWQRSRKKQRLKALFGLTLEQYEAMLRAQDGKCANSGCSNRR